MMPDGSLGHAEMDTDGGVIMLSTTAGGYEGPKKHREHCARAQAWSQSQASWVINGVLVYVDDIDAHYARATGEGVTLLSTLEVRSGQALSRRGPGGASLDVPAALMHCRVTSDVR
jgi:uncharacterized glyoxalase superfamily protein PhnB